MNREKNCLFPQAVTFPDFFNHNLNDQNRVLKVVSGRYCWARAFYYQLMKIIFEFESDEQNSIDFGQLLINICRITIERARDLSPNQDLSLYIPLLNNFLHQISENSEIGFQQYINTHKQIDEALIKILTCIIEQANQPLNNEQKIKYLGEVFNETMFEFDNGVKFQQSDTFLYFQSEELIYIAYLNYVGEFDQYQPDGTSKEEGASISGNQDKSADEISRDRIPSKKQNKVNVQQQAQSEVNQYVTTSIIPIRQTVENAINTILQKQEQKSPVEYLFTNRFRSNSNSMRPSTPPNVANYPRNAADQIKSPLENSKQESILQANKSQELGQNMEFTLGKRKIDVYDKSLEKQEDHFKILSKMQVKHTETLEDINIHDADFKYKTKKSDVVERNKFFDYSNQMPNRGEEDLFYKPTSNRNSINQVSKPAPKKDPLDICNDSEKGTFYRKFTDTRILNLLSQPYRTKVKMLKNRFIGVHSRGNRAPVYQQQF